MAINVGDNFSYQGKKYLDSRQSFETLQELQSYTEVPEGFIAYCEENKKRYEFIDGVWTEYIVSAEIEDDPNIATKTYVDELIESHTHEEYLTEHQDISHLATKAELNNKLDDVEINEEETTDSYTALDFFANGNKVKTVYVAGGGGGSSASAYISTTLPEEAMVETGFDFDILIDFYSPNPGKGTLKVFVNDVDVLSTAINQGETTTTLTHDKLTKGTNRIVVYVLDRIGTMSNSLTFYVRYGSTELTGEFDSSMAYDYGANIRYYFVATALDTSLALTFYMSIDNVLQNGVSCVSDVRGYFTFPNSLEAGGHYCECWVEDSNGSKSNVEQFNLVILDTNTLAIVTETRSASVEEGSQLVLDYRVYKKNETSFIIKTYVDEELVSTGTCGLTKSFYKTSTLREGMHNIKIEAWDITETVSDYITWTVIITPSTYTMIEPATAGSIFMATAKNRTNGDANREIWTGYNQDGESIDAALFNFAFNSESGWMDDQLFITGNSHVEIPIQPLANNARYGFTLDIEFLTKPIGVEDAEVLRLWNDTDNCGIKITTEQLILQSKTGNKCELYFTEDQIVSAIFIIDRHEKTAKVYLNGVMCAAFALSDYTAEGVSYLEDFTVNDNLYLGGKNKNGYSTIKNLRIYELALSSSEILNNFISNETDKTKQQALVNFQKGEDLPTVTVYCDFSGLGKDDKKYCDIVYNSPDPVKYGESFSLMGKYSQLQYQGTSSMQYPIKNYRLNPKDANGKVKIKLPFSQPETRFTLKADFMSSGHWQNTGLTKWINDNLYNYKEDDPKTMNPAKWWAIQNGKDPNDYRECIYGFPCRLILVNDGNSPLNEGQQEPTPGNTKDMGIFNFNLDKDCENSLGFKIKDFPNAISMEVTANSDTSAGAFISGINGMSANLFTSGEFVYGRYDDDCTRGVTIESINATSFNITTSAARPHYAGAMLELDTEIGKKYRVSATCDIKYGAAYLAGPNRSNSGSWIETAGNNYKIELTFEAVSEKSEITFYAAKSAPSENKGISEVTYKNVSIREVKENMDKDELAYIKESFELRYPDEKDVPEGWGFMSIDGVEGGGLKALIDWVDNSTDEQFVSEFEEHFHKDYTLRYFLLVMVLGMVDNLGKNMMLDSYDGKIWMPRFYDCDTICSYDNSGAIKFDVDIEMAQGYWNTSSSRLWTRVRDLFHDELVVKYNDMRQNGMSYESFMNVFYNEQIAKIPQKYYNMDADVKYLPYADEYLGKAHGDGYEHLKRWLKNRLIFTDSLYDYAPSYTNDMITFRANTTEEMSITIETYTPVYQHVSWYNGNTQKEKIAKGTRLTFKGFAQAATDQEVLVYGGSNIKRIIGISTMNPNSMLIGNASRLVELDISDCPILTDINSNKANFTPHTYLNKLDISNCPRLGGSLRLNYSPLIQEVNAMNTSVTDLQLPSSIRNLHTLKVPGALKTLTLSDAPILSTLEFDGPNQLEMVSMTNCNALTNVINFDMTQIPTVTLNNSYDADELYMSKTTNLSLVNMANVKKLIFLPNNEHETFNLTQLRNYPDYTISAINCPSLKTFITTAEYRKSCKPMIPTEVSRVFYDKVLVDGVFTLETSGYLDINTGYETQGSDRLNAPGYYKLDASVKYTFTATNGEWLRVIIYDLDGNFIPELQVENVNVSRITYTPTNDCLVRVGCKPMDETNSTSIVATGGNVYEADTRIIIIDGYGEVKPNTAFCTNTLDISNTKITDVSFLCTTDIYQLKLPDTVNSFICDSAYDLDTNFAEDSDFDTIHHTLINAYTTNHSDNVYIYEDIVDVYDANDPRWTSSGRFNADKHEFIADSGAHAITNWMSVTPNTTFSIRSNGANYSSEIYEFESLETTSFIKKTTDGTPFSITLTENTNYVVIWGGYAKSGAKGYTFTYKEAKTPNLTLSSADGSLIFSMYAPTVNTAVPAEGIWDLYGLTFEEFYTYGMNNDIVVSGNTISMPHRYADYNITIQNAEINPTNHPTMLYPLLVNEDKPITGTIDYTNYQGDDLSYTMAYANTSEVDIVIPNSVSMNSQYLYNIDKESEYVYVDPRTIVQYKCTSNTKPVTMQGYSAYSMNEIDNGDGTYTVSVIADDLSNLPTRISFYDMGGALLEVYFVNTDNISDMSNMFYTCNKLTSVYTSNWNTSKVTNMTNLFHSCPKITSLDVSGWDTSKVTNMSGMFYSCKVTSLDVSGWDTSKVTNMSGMFYSCAITSLDVSDWDTSEVTNMSNMFYSCKITSLDVSGWDTSKVTNMSGMFNNCNTLETLDVSVWDTSKVTDMSYIFKSCSSIKEIDLTGWKYNESGTTFHNMFADCTSLESIKGLDISKYNGRFGGNTTQFFTFNGCTALQTIKNLDVSFTAVMASSYKNTVTDDYWINAGWRWFNNLNNLKDITFIGQVELYDNMNVYRILRNCDTSSFTLETWRSFASIFPETSAANKSIEMGRTQANLNAVPEEIKIALTNKGYTLTYSSYSI